jgi:hypothetical protein
VSAAAFFDAARALKREMTGSAGIGLEQSEVDAFNAILGQWKPPPVPGDIPDDYWPLLAQIESGNRPYVKASSSSASGLYQFVKATWIGEGGEWGTNTALAFGGLKPTVEEQLRIAKSFTEKNANILRSFGIPINKASLYGAHFLGPVSAAKIIGSDVAASAELLAGPNATSANPSILRGKTVGEFLTWLHGKTGDWAR